MSAVQQFQRSLSELADTESTVTTPEEFPDVLEAAIEQPAVGAELPFDSVSLDGTDVTLDPSPDQLREAETGVSGSRLGIASLGTVAVESRSAGDEFVSLYPETHVVAVRESDLRTDLKSGFEWLDEEFEDGNRSFILATGPSATGDMGALVQGVHGPERVHVIIIQDNE
ncbi:LUD domain-containing protein [Halopenitus sp. H-Gu1]|uniref:LUD domain-containing protein n=1 Tax=Halopenitus sp. H-Gu1 TaxID=3242697 RepID=UPI00359D1AFE